MKNLIAVLVLLCPIALFAQDDTPVEETKERKYRTIAFGVKAGSPIGAGFSGEFILPFAENRIALYGDYSKLNDLTVDDTTIGHEFSEFGLQIFFRKGGSGFYIGGGYASTMTRLSYEGTVSSSGNDYVGLATTSLNLELINAKIGIKTGGLFFFKLEVGYGFGDIPQELEVIGTTNVMGMPVQETSIEEIPEVPGISESGMLTAGIGIGLSF